MLLKTGVCLNLLVEHVILPMFYRRQSDFAEIMRSAIIANGSFFNAQRMLSQYKHNAYSVIERD